MADPVLQVAVDAAFALAAEAGSFTPASGSGSVAVAIILRPAEDEIADVFEVAQQRPGWRLRIRQSELATRPRAGDMCVVDGLTLRVRSIESDVLGLFWKLTAVEAVPFIPGVQAGFYQMPLLVGGIGVAA